MKIFLVTGIVAATMATLATPAAAQVTFTGTTAGCFGPATGGGTCAPTTGTSTNNGLTFTSGTFDQTTDAFGFLALGGTSDGLGTFSMTGAADTFTGDIFRLLVSFAAPSGTTPASTMFDVLLQGTITGANSGGVFVNFDNTARLFASSAGPFTFAINDVSISSSSAAQIVSGQIQASVPEPGTWALMLLGFGGIGYSMRRKRRSQDILQLA